MQRWGCHIICNQAVFFIFCCGWVVLLLVKLFFWYGLLCSCCGCCGWLHFSSFCVINSLPILIMLNTISRKNTLDTCSRTPLLRHNISNWFKLQLPLQKLGGTRVPNSKKQPIQLQIWSLTCSNIVNLLTMPFSPYGSTITEFQITWVFPSLISHCCIILLVLTSAKLNPLLLACIQRM